MKKAVYGLPLLLLLTVFALHGRTAARQVAVQQSDGITVDKDVQYGEAGGQKLLLDAYRPQVSGLNRPAVLFVHGGGWAAGDKAGFGFLASMLAKDGYVCFSAN